MSELEAEEHQEQKFQLTEFSNRLLATGITVEQLVDISMVYEKHHPGLLRISEVDALRAWAEEGDDPNGCTAWGSKFDAVMAVARRLAGQPLCEMTDLETARARVAELEAAIRTHRDAKGNDRCWLDDRDLYAVLGDVEADTSLPPRETFLANCARYYECRRKPEDGHE